MTRGREPGPPSTGVRRVFGSWLWKVIFAGVVLVFALDGVDRIGAPTRQVGGTITDERNTWSAKRRHRCMVYVSTPEGDLNTRYIGECRGEWKRGEAVKLEIVYGRLTGKAVVAGSLKHNASP